MSMLARLGGMTLPGVALPLALLAVLAFPGPAHAGPGYQLDSVKPAFSLGGEYAHGVAVDQTSQLIYVTVGSTNSLSAAPGRVEQFDPGGTPTAQWRVTPAEIKRYAQASGDKNPIHVSALGAKAFGFPTTIAHGMWSAAAMLSGLEGRIADAVRYSVEFAKPVVLPVRVSYYAQAGAAGAWDLQLRKTSKPATLHAVARLEAL